jgi:hypothetical protein
VVEVKGDDLHISAVVGMFARLPQVHAWRRARGGGPVGFDQGAVDAHVAVPGGHGGRQRPVQARRPGDQEVDAFVQVVLAGGLADRL